MSLRLGETGVRGHQPPPPAPEGTGSNGMEPERGRSFLCMYMLTHRPERTASNHPSIAPWPCFLPAPMDPNG